MHVWHPDFIHELHQQIMLYLLRVSYEELPLPLGLCSVFRTCGAITSTRLQFALHHQFEPCIQPCWCWPTIYQKCLSWQLWFTAKCPEIPLSAPQPTIRNGKSNLHLICNQQNEEYVVKHLNDQINFHSTLVQANNNHIHCLPNDHNLVKSKKCPNSIVNPTSTFYPCLTGSHSRTLSILLPHHWISSA